jgi:hypothetical protein
LVAYLIPRFPSSVERLARSTPVQVQEYEKYTPNSYICSRIIGQKVAPGLKLDLRSWGKIIKVCGSQLDAIGCENYTIFIGKVINAGVVRVILCGMPGEVENLTTCGSVVFIIYLRFGIYPI